MDDSALLEYMKIYTLSLKKLKCKAMLRLFFILYTNPSQW